MSLFTPTPIRISLLLLISALFVSGCSDSSSGDDQLSGMVAAINDDVPSAIATSGADATSSVSGTTSGTTTGADATAGTMAGSTESSVSDTTASTLTRVTFDITVPTYVSNALQVRVVWGERNSAASWVADESWTLVEDFPTGTSNPLTVTFFDNNGELPLASYNAVFKTDTGPTESYRITEDQFDTEQWDTDNDGASNLAESIAGTNPMADVPPQPEQIALEFLEDKTFRISWGFTPGVEFFRVLENPDGVAGYTQIGDDLDAATLSLEHRVALYKRINARYIVQACNSTGCTDSAEQVVSDTLTQSIVYIKASNTHRIAFFGNAVSLSADGNTLAVGAVFENSIEGAVYMFQRMDDRWQQTAYLKASNADAGDGFGTSVSLSNNGDTLAVGARSEDSSSTGVDGNQNDNSADVAGGAGAVYVFTNDGGSWQQQAYLKASHSSTEFQLLFGSEVSLSADGTTLAVGAYREAYAGKGVNPELTDHLIHSSGAVFVFHRSNDQWQQQAYLKASNSDYGDQFGWSISLSADGNILAVGAPIEQSAATGVNGLEADNSIAGGAGAVYIFDRSNDTWRKQTYVKASNPDENDRFGWSVSLSADGKNLAVGAIGERSLATGIGGNQADDAAEFAGAVYVFEFAADRWLQQAYVKASNTDASDQFGYSVSLSSDGSSLAVGAPRERSAAVGINGNEFDNSAESAGAAYMFARNSGSWLQESYVKASNTDGGSGYGGGDGFGLAVSLSADGNTLAVGAENEDGGATGISRDMFNNSAHRAGAVYLY